MIRNVLKVPFDDKRIFGLDILRALAILFVVIGHGRHLLPDQFKRVHDLLSFDGVSMFFVLSGFLIGGILIKIIENQKATNKVLLNFWIRRWFRTVPNYLLILTIVLLGFLVVREGFRFWEMAPYYIFSQNLFYPHPEYFPEAWSLSIEEWFYLLIPAFIFIGISFLKLPPKKSLALVVGLVLIFVTAVRLYRFNTLTISTPEDWELIFRKQVITRLDSILFGVIGAYVQFYKPKFWLGFKRLFFVAGLIVLGASKYFEMSGIYTFSSFYSCVWSFTITSIGVLLLLPFLSNYKSGKGGIYKGITIISLISYSMYLINLTVVQQILINPFPWGLISDNPDVVISLKYIAYWTFTIVGSILIYKYYEMPCTALRDSKWVKKKLSLLSSKK